MVANMGKWLSKYGEVVMKIREVVGENDYKKQASEDPPILGFADKKQVSEDPPPGPPKNKTKNSLSVQKKDPLKGILRPFYKAHKRAL